MVGVAWRPLEIEGLVEGPGGIVLGMDGDGANPCMVRRGQAIRQVAPSGVESALPVNATARHVLVPFGPVALSVCAFAIASYAAAGSDRFAALRVSATATGGRWRKTLQHAMVTLQVAGGVSILIFAGALARTVGALTTVDLGARNHAAIVAEVRCRARGTLPPPKCVASTSKCRSAER